MRGTLGCFGRLGLMVLGVGACSSGEEAEPASGAAGGPCYPNNTCDSTLVCLSNKCVDPTSGNQNTNPGTKFDSGACLDCGQDKCTSQADACNQLNGCGKLLSCTLECANDASCSSKCASAGSYTSEDQAAYTNYQACLVTSCVKQCTPEVNVPVAPTVDPTVSPASAATTTGSPGMTAVSPDPEGERACRVVKPPTTCLAADAFVLEEDGTELVGVANPTYLELVLSEASVKADFVLEAGQLGVLQFTFSEALQPDRIAFEGGFGQVEYITLEDAYGNGCQYQLTGARRLVRYKKVNSQTLDVDWHGCWGRFEDYANSEPNGLTVLNLRTRMSFQNESYAITVTSLLL